MRIEKVAIMSQFNDERQTKKNSYNQKSRDNSRLFWFINKQVTFELHRLSTPFHITKVVIFRRNDPNMAPGRTLAP